MKQFTRLRELCLRHAVGNNVQQQLRVAIALLDRTAQPVVRLRLILIETAPLRVDQPHGILRIDIAVFSRDQHFCRGPGVVPEQPENT